MPAYTAKQRVKNTVYLGVGTAGRLRHPTTSGLRVLLYHKVNDVQGNPGSVTPALFAEHMAMIAAEGYRPVSLGEVLEHLGDGAPLPPRATLITFDDGYLDNLVNAAPILAQHGFPAVLFMSVGRIGSDTPFPHDERRPAPNPTLDWNGLEEIERLGVRVESHGIAHVPLASLDDAAAEQDITGAKQILEEHLGRPVRAYAYVKGGTGDFGARHREMLRRVGYEAAFTTVTGSNGGGSDPFALRRYNVEPYPASTLALVLRGACDAMAVKDSRPGTAARRVFNRVLGTTSQ